MRVFSATKRQYRLPPFERLSFIGLYGFLFFVALSTLWWPPGVDQGSFATGAKIVLDGGRPYLDIWEQKGPACHLTYALSILIFGDNMWGVRALDMLFLFVAALFLWRFLSKKTDVLAAHTGTLLFCFVYLRLGFWHTAQPDSWAAMSVLVAFLLVTAPAKAGYLRLVLAGMLIGLATQYKFLYAGFLIPFWLYEIWPRENRLGGKFFRCLLLCGGFVLANAFFVIWLASNQALGEFLNITFDFNRLVHHNMQKTDIPFLKIAFSPDLIYYRYTRHFVGALPFLILGVFIYIRSGRRFTTSLLFFWAVGLGNAIIQGYATYHLISAHGPAAILTGLGIYVLQQYFDTRSDNDAMRVILKRWLGVACLVVCVMSAYPSAKLAVHTAGYVLGLKAPYRYFRNFRAGWFNYNESRTAADYIKENTPKDATIFVWAFNPVIYYLSDRKPASRFIINYPLISSKGTPFYERYRREFMDAIAANKPAYIVIAKQDQFHLFDQTSEKHFRKFKRFYNYVRQNYVCDTQIGKNTLWRRQAQALPNGKPFS